MEFVIQIHLETGSGASTNDLPNLRNLLANLTSMLDPQGGGNSGPPPTDPARLAEVIKSEKCLDIADLSKGVTCNVCMEVLPNPLCSSRQLCHWYVFHIGHERQFFSGSAQPREDEYPSVSSFSRFSVSALRLDVFALGFGAEFTDHPLSVSCVEEYI